MTQHSAAYSKKCQSIHFDYALFGLIFYPFSLLTRQGKLVPDTFPTDVADFTDTEETPEERAEYFEKRYKGLSPEQRAELEAFDKENEEMWLEQVEESIKKNIPKAMHLNFKHITFGM